VYGSAGKGGLYVPSDFMSAQEDEEQQPLLATPQERSYTNELIEEERELLEDNHLLPNSSADTEVVETTWEDEVTKGTIRTNIKFEMLALTQSSLPLVVTFLLQNSFSLASIFSVGHIGKEPLAGITLGTMTANITGFAAIQGLTTCLDTLCSQAYGAGKMELVGLQFIRCAVFAITCFIPVGFVWIWYSSSLLRIFVPESELIGIAAGYLRVVCFGMPGFILFECGKRFLQSQGVFHAGTYVLLVCAPLNALMNYLFVWQFGFGYIGAPLAVMINYWLMPLGLLIYALLNPDCLKCWPSNFKIAQAFENWGKMVELALPGVIMVEAEFLGFEIVTLMASNLGTAELAAQSVVSSICALAYQIPFSVSIATATRAANYIGACLPYNARICCRASMNMGLIIGIINSCIILYFRGFIVRIFTSDHDVIDQVYKTISVIGFMEIVDCLNACSAGCLRGQGLQKIGGYINIFSFYVIGLPLSYLFTFHYNMELKGLWLGIVCGLTSVTFLQIYSVFWGSNWDKIVDAAKTRNAEC
jgi:MATE family multidrug resistance protein